MEHLDGILFVDHLSALKRNIILRKLAKDLRLNGPPGPQGARARAAG
jgi:peptide deformylase